MKNKKVIVTEAKAKEDKKFAQRLEIEDIENKKYYEIYDLLLKERMKNNNVYVQLPNGEKLYSLYDDLTATRQTCQGKRSFVMNYKQELRDIYYACIDNVEDFIDNEKEWIRFAQNNCQTISDAINLETFTNLLRNVHTQNTNLNMTEVLNFYNKENELPLNDKNAKDLNNVLNLVSKFVKDEKGKQFVNKYLQDCQNLEDDNIERE